MIGILAVSGLPLIRLGLHHLCVTTSMMKMVAEASSVREGLQLVDELQPDVVVVDLPRPHDQQPDLHLVAELVRRGPPVLALVAGVPGRELLDLLRAGVRGVATRDAELADLQGAIEGVSRDDGRFHDVRTRDPTYRSSASPGPRLTRKESEVLTLVASGRTNREIAEVIGVRTTTAKFHIANLLGKFGASRRSELAFHAAQRGLFCADPEWCRSV